MRKAFLLRSTAHAPYLLSRTFLQSTQLNKYTLASLDGATGIWAQFFTARAYQYLQLTSNFDGRIYLNKMLDVCQAVKHNVQYEQTEPSRARPGNPVPR